MVFVIVWFLDQFTLKPVPSMNGIWIIAFFSHLHVWVSKFKPSLMLFKLSILTLNYVIWVNLFAILFDEAQHVVKKSTTGYVPVCYEVINLLVKPQNFLLMFFICKLKGLHLIFTVGNCCIFFFDGLLMFFLYCIFPTSFLVSYFTKATALAFLDGAVTSIEPSKLMKIPWGLFSLPREGIKPPPSRSDLGWV